jgi:hypothetical protein
VCRLRRARVRRAAARAANGDAHVVEALGVGADTRARVVAQDLAQLDPQQRAQRLERVGGPLRPCRHDAERLEDLWRAVRRRRTGPGDLLRDLAEPARVAAAKLDLDLDEGLRDGLAVHHRDLVDGDLGRRLAALDELATAACAQLGDRFHRPVAQMREQELP